MRKINLIFSFQLFRFTFSSYVIPVIFLSVLLNIPKFMESKFIWEPVPKEDFNGTLDFDPANITDGDDVEYIIGLGISDLREDPDYIRFYINWTRLITTGVLPFGALIYFNFGIFRGIQVQSYIIGA